MTTTVRTPVEGITATVTPDRDPGFVLIEWTGAGITHREVVHGGDLARALAEVRCDGSGRALVDHMVKALRTAWQDDYSVRSVAEGVADAALEWFAARQSAAPVDTETAEVIAERERHASLGYDERSDDERGTNALAGFAQGYVARAVAQGNRSDLIKAASLLLDAAASFRRTGNPNGSGDTCTCEGPSVISDGPDVDCPRHGDGLAAAPSVEDRTSPAEAVRRAVRAYEARRALAADVALAESAARQPAPVVSAELREDIIARVQQLRFIDDGQDVGTMQPGHAVGAVFLTLAALGIEVQDRG